jgi:hypothetical protein
VPVGKKMAGSWERYILPAKYPDPANSPSCLLGLVFSALAPAGPLNTVAGIRVIMVLAENGTSGILFVKIIIKGKIPLSPKLHKIKAADLLVVGRFKIIHGVVSFLNEITLGF